MNLNEIIDEVGKDKGIEREVLVETLKSAILTAARRTYGQQREIEAQYNELTGEVELFQIITVEADVENPFREVSVEEVYDAGFEAEPGDELLFQIFYREEDRDKARTQDARYGKLLKLDSYNSTFGRIAAQTAKQVIIQRVREAERDIIFNEYKDRVTEMVTGVVRRFEKGNVIVDLGRADAILPRREQTPRESYRPGDRIQAMIKEVQRSSREPQVVLTRADPQILFKLFEGEVPEIYESIVRIVAVAREPGVRSKVAVYSRDSDVDPVGACVGMRGSRVQAVVQELRGEKIDIVPYIEDPARFVCNAISPAEVSKVLIDETNMTMELIVPDDQLSLAIGRGGQNVRLAAQLTGWNLDIISVTRLNSMMSEMRANLLEFTGITEDMIDTLFTLGYNKLEHIAQSSVGELAQIPGFTADSSERIIEAAEIIMTRPKTATPATMTREDHEKRLLKQTVKGVGNQLADRLHEAGYTTVERLAVTEDYDALAALMDDNTKKARQIVISARDYVRKKRELVEDEAFEAFRAQVEAGEVRFEIEDELARIAAEQEAEARQEEEAAAAPEPQEAAQAEEEGDDEDEDDGEAFVQPVILGTAEVHTSSLEQDEPSPPEAAVEAAAAQPEVLEEAPAEEEPAEEAPAEEAPAEEAPAEEAPVDEAPAEEEPGEEAPADEAPTEEAPAEEPSSEEESEEALSE